MGFEGLNFHTVDVFTGQKFLGNPLAVIHVPLNRRDELTQEEKQRIATEFNLSETVFLHYPEGYENASEWPIDIFTKTAEIPFAGHPTVGTSSLLSRITGLEKFTLLTKAGSIDVNVDEGKASLAVPHNIRVHAATLGQDDLAKLQPHAKSTQESSPVVSIVKGMTFVMIKLKDRTELDMVTTTVRTLDEFVKLDEGWQVGLIGGYYYAEEDTKDFEQKRVVHSRMIKTSLEDPATGSAASGLSAFLAIEAAKQHSDLRGKAIDLSITQGERMGRKSDITVQVKLDDQGQVQGITLSGNAVPVMSGTLL